MTPASIRVRRIDPDDERSVRAFNAFPRRLYRDTPYWSPPFRSDEKLIFDRRKYPFYEHSLADFFLIEKDGRTAGRFALLQHRPYCQVHNEKTAFFHLLEFEQDKDLVEAFIDTASAWCHGHGLNQLAGPRCFLRSGGYGLLVEGFDQIPAVGIPYNLPYYGDMLENAGFVKETDLYMSPLPNNYHKKFPRRPRKSGGRMASRSCISAVNPTCASGSTRLEVFSTRLLPATPLTCP